MSRVTKRRIATPVLVGLGVLVALVLAGGASYYASGSPDGLNRVAEDHGFGDTAKDSPTAGSPLADYGTKGVDDDRLSGGIAGVVGVLAVLALGSTVAFAVRRRSAGKAGMEQEPAGVGSGTTSDDPRAD